MVTGNPLREMDGYPSQEKGFILIMMLFSIGLVALLVTGLANISNTELLVRHYEQKSLSAQMAAESGLEDALEILSEQPTWSTGFTNKSFPSGGTDKYTVTVVNSSPYVTLTAIGSSGYAEHKIVADICLTGTSTPYTIRIDSWEEM